MKAKLSENTELGFDIRWVDHNGAESFESTKNTTIGWASEEMDWNADLSKIGKIQLIKTGTGDQPGQEPENVAVARNDTPKVDGKLTEWDDSTPTISTLKPDFPRKALPPRVPLTTVPGQEDRPGESTVLC